MDTFVPVRKASRRREDILRAAKKLFLEKGYEKTSVREIVEEAGTSMGNLYHHFPDKFAILKVLCKGFIDILRNQIAEVQQMSLRPEVAFALDFRVGFITTLEDPKLSQMWLLVRNHPEIHEYSLENKRIRLRTFFGNRFSDEEVNYLAIATQGIADAFFSQKRAGKLVEDASTLSNHIIDYSLRLLGYSQPEIERAIQEAEKYLIEKHIKTAAYFEF